MSDQNGLQLERYSLGMGDRFAHQAKAQLAACVCAAAQGAAVTPVWNKSNREHKTVGSEPASARAAADAAVQALGWKEPYFLDADHINLETVDRFLASCDFFTLDVAHAIAQRPKPGAVEAFLARHRELVGRIEIAGLAEPLAMSKEKAFRAASKYLHAVGEAAAIYRHIAQRAAGSFITEVSMDETDTPQTPSELLLILAALADENIPVQTIAPKFTGRFNKGVDYVGDVEQFEREFSSDVAVIAHAVERYKLPKDLKLSVHSGSDKFSLYAPIRRALGNNGAGVHVKTAGTTWLEELIGLAEAGGEGLALAKEIYAEAYEHRRELCEPYASVIDIDASKLPTPATVNGWTAEQYAGALRHDQQNPLFNPNLRQLLHVGYKIAAKMGERYTKMLDACEESIARNVTTNLFERHIRPLFLGA
ncbi:MAG TPA: tagaturonate epimerase family protein [Bryobacteraceae bacterium]